MESGRKVKLDRSERKRKIASIADRIITYLEIEVPDITIDFMYTNQKIISRYICILSAESKRSVVRVSDHDSDRKDTYNYNVVVRYNEDFKLCSTVMDIIKKLNFA